MATGGEIIRDLNEDPPLMKIAAEQLIRNVIHEDGGSLITTVRKMSSAHSTPPAGSSTASSPNPGLETPNLPTDSPDEPKCRTLTGNYLS